eukprot:m.176373 g.176373  ORF g.176373 m.176373 type:complete len:67 (+) comp13529_c6_seq4:132-332(+)
MDFHHSIQTTCMFCFLIEKKKMNSDTEVTQRRGSDDVGVDVNMEQSGNNESVGRLRLFGEGQQEHH